MTCALAGPSVLDSDEEWADITSMVVPPPPPPELSSWSERAYDRLIEAIGPGAENLTASEKQTLIWLAGWNVTDNMVNIFRKAREG